MTTYREHLFSEIPNNRLTRWMVKYLNRRMAKSDSKYRLRPRYRKPKVGGYGWFGHVEKKNAKTFSIYLEQTKANRKAEARAKRIRDQQFPLTLRR